MKNLLLALLLLALAGCAKSSAPPPDGGGHVEDRRSCDEFIASLPAGYAHGWVTVPEEPGNAASPSVRVFYYYPTPIRGEPVLFLNGGPGSSSHGMNAFFDPALQKLGVAGKLTLIYMDQRGTGCSSDYPSDPSDANVLERARWYGTRGIVADAEAVRRAILGDQGKWSVLGQSFGSIAAHRYAILYPDHVNKLIAYAGIPVRDPRDFMAARIRQQVSTWEAYLAQHPDDRARLATLLKDQVASQCRTWDRGQLCGYELVAPLVAGYLGFLDSWDWLHQALDAMVPGASVDEDAVGDFADRTAALSTHDQLLGLLAVHFYDMSSGQFDAETCRAIYAQLAPELPNTNFAAYLTECSAPVQLGYAGEGYAAVAAHFGARNDWMTLDQVKAALAGRPDWFYLYSGGLDPYVPASMFPPEVSALAGLATYRAFAAAGHEGFLTEAQVFEDLLGADQR